MVLTNHDLLLYVNDGAIYLTQIQLYEFEGELINRYSKQIFDFYSISSPLVMEDTVCGHAHVFSTFGAVNLDRIRVLPHSLFNVGICL